MTTKQDIAQAIAYADILLDELPGNAEIEFIVWTLDALSSIPHLLGIDNQTDIEDAIKKGE